MRAMLAAVILVAASAHAQPSVVAQTRSSTPDGSWAVKMRFDRHPAKDTAAITLDVTRGKHMHGYAMKHAFLHPSPSYAKPLLAVVKLPGIDEPLLQVRYSTSGDLHEDIALSTVIARVSPEGELTPVLATDVMMTDGGPCRSKETLRVESHEGGVMLAKRNRSNPKPGHADDCPESGEGKSGRSYMWNGKCFAHQDSENELGVINERECLADGLQQGDEPVLQLVR